MTKQSMNILLKTGFLAIFLGFAMYFAAPVHAQTLPHLTPVVAGDVWQGYGDADPLGASPVHSRGIVYMTAARAIVSAPATGIVEFAGAVDGLGKVVVLNIGDNYRVVLTGLSQVSVHKGEIVESQNSLGLMPATRSEPAHLYMELRHGEEPVDPQMAKPIQIAMR